jgi:beta-galactosidase GanA
MALVACFIVSLLLLSSSALFRGQETAAPHLSHRGVQTDFIVDGQPFIMLGGQAQNSSASNLEDIETVYQALDAVHANTAEIPLSWNLIEPEQGKFDFHLLDGAVTGARRHGLKLVFLWFGTTKNGTFSYVPDWIKRDKETYLRARDMQDDEMPALSPFCGAALKADEQAFSKVMQHIHEIDQQEHTVIMMQVENETGLLHTDRDYSLQATRTFQGAVPTELLHYLHDHLDLLTPAMQSAWNQAGSPMQGNWRDVFGDLAEEVFSAWSVARYVDGVAAAGKAEYDIPYYINVALRNTGSARPGDWPSGGATSDVFDVWKATATHIDILAPDIYRTDFSQIASFYNRENNVLFVPETGFAPYYAPCAFAALAMNAIGFSPFGIDRDLKNGELTNAGAAFEENYRVLKPLLSVIEKERYQGRLFGFVAEMFRHEALAVPLGDSLAAVVHFDEPFVADTAAHRAGGLIVKMSPDTYIVAGEGFHVDFEELKGIPRAPEYLSIEQGTFDGDRWVTQKALNGDEENINLISHQPRILRVRLNRTMQ